MKIHRTVTRYLSTDGLLTDDCGNTVIGTVKIHHTMTRYLPREKLRLDTLQTYL